MAGIAQFWHRYRRRLVVVIGISLMIILGIWLWKAKFTEPLDSYAACAKAGYPILDSEPPACLAHGHTFVGPRSAPTPTPEAGVAQDFQLLVQGDSGGPYLRRQEVITTPGDWRRYWTAVH